MESLVIHAVSLDSRRATVLLSEFRPPPVACSRALLMPGLTLRTSASSISRLRKPSS